MVTKKKRAGRYTLLPVAVRLYIIQALPLMTRNRSSLVDTLRIKFPDLEAETKSRIYSRVWYFLNHVYTVKKATPLKKLRIKSFHSTTVNGITVTSEDLLKCSRPMTESSENIDLCEGPRVKKLMLRSMLEAVSGSHNLSFSVTTKVSITVKVQKMINDKVGLVGSNIPLNITKGSDTIHPVYVLSDCEWNHMRDNSNLLSGFARNNRKGYTVTSYNLEHVGVSVDEEFESSSVSKGFYLMNVKGDYLAIVTYLIDIHDEPGIRFISMYAYNDNSKVLLILCAESPTESSLKFHEEFAKNMNHIRTNIYAGNKPIHFGSTGSMYGVGVVGSYQLVDGVSVNEFARKHKSNIIGELSHSNIGKWLSDCIENLNSKCKGIVEMLTVSNMAMLCSSMTMTDQSDIIMRYLVSEKCQASACFPEAYLCVNCKTHILHTEKDCAVTAIHVPQQCEREDCVMFQVSINEGDNVYLCLKPHVSIIYSAFLLTHRQVGDITEGSRFYNIVAYSNKHLYECLRKPLQRKNIQIKTEWD